MGNRLTTGRCRVVLQPAAARLAPFAAAWRRPVYRDGIALVTSSALSSVVGLAYWVLAARLLPPAQVGIGSALVSTLMLLGSVGGLHLDMALLRFVPVAGSSVRRFVTSCYAAAVTASAVVGVVFALGARWWAPQLVAAVGPVGLVVFLGLASPVWALFVMQDQLLTAVGRALLVPVANLAFAVLKVALLAAAAVLAIPNGIAASWTVATVLLVVVVTVGLVRGHAASRSGASGSETREPAEPLTLRTVARLVRADFAGELCWTAVVFGLPVLVLARLGAEAAATFGIAWTVACALYLVPHGMGQALVAHLAADPANLPAVRRGMTLRAYAVLVPAVLALCVAARPLLAVFGPHYAATGTAVLALAALSALPDVVTRATLAAARVARQRAVLIGFPALAAVQILVGSWIVAPRAGLLGVGLVLLGAQVVTAVVVLVVGRSGVRTPGTPTGGAGSRADGARPTASRSTGVS